MDKSHFFGKTAEQIGKILVSDQKYGWMSCTLSVDWILHIAPGVPAPAKKVCCIKVLQSVVLRGGGRKPN